MEERKRRLDYDGILNMESFTGEWDFFHSFDNKKLKLVRFDPENDNRMEELEISYESMDDLLELMLRIKGQTRPISGDLLTPLPCIEVEDHLRSTKKHLLGGILAGMVIMAIIFLLFSIV